MNNLVKYYNAFKTSTLKTLLQNAIDELEDVGNGDYRISEAQLLNLEKRVKVLRNIINERLEQGEANDKNF